VIAYQKPVLYLFVSNLITDYRQSIFIIFCYFSFDAFVLPQNSIFEPSLQSYEWLTKYDIIIPSSKSVSYSSKLKISICWAQITSNSSPNRGGLTHHPSILCPYVSFFLFLSFSFYLWLTFEFITLIVVLSQCFSP